MNDPHYRQSRFGLPGRIAKLVITRLLRFLIVRQAETDGRLQVVERWLPAIENSRVMAREANAGLAAMSARLTALQQENEVVRELAEVAIRRGAELVGGADVAVAGDIGARLARVEALQQGVAESLADVRNCWLASERRFDEIVRRLDALAFDVSQLSTRLHVTPYMSRPLEQWTPTVRSRPGSFDYFGFEEIFRGPESFIRERQRAYIPLVREHAPVLDVGCGRGEFLELLAEENIEAIGIDANPQMISHCVAKDLRNVIQSNVLEYLATVASGSLGTIFSAQVVEHLTPDDLLAFVSAALERLREGGVFIAETVNANSIEGAKTFFVDSTHVKPLFPETLAFLCRSVGYASVRVFYPNGAGFDETAPTLQPEFAVVATR